MRSSCIAALVWVLAGTACTSTRESSSSTSETTASSAGASSSGTSAATSSGGQPSTSGAASSAGASSSTGSASSSGGTGTTGGSSSGTTTGLPRVFVDGGYVFCSPDSPGLPSWQCPSGTYFCAVDAGRTCAQCRSDSDCANADLPTYDPKRLHCDLDSGILGYQGFCQICLSDADCAGNPAGPACALTDSAAVAGGQIDDFGFETCYPEPLGCPPGALPAIGGCRYFSYCRTDADCVGAINSQVQLTPYCVAGQCALSNQGDACPDCKCFFDASCGGALADDAGLSCDTVTRRCTCGGDGGGQCGGAWPVCEQVGGEGVCGCDDDAQCGDAGLRCLTFPATVDTFGGNACALPCTDPRFPACMLWSTTTPICDSATGFCRACDSDADCAAVGTAWGAAPYCRADGQCGCSKNADCATGLVCLGYDSHSSAGVKLGTCGTPAPSCKESGCQGGCDYDSGVCAAGRCQVDADCSGGYGTSFCDLDGGFCIGCRDDADCAITIYGSEGYSYCDPQYHQCSPSCATDADCATSRSGPHCVANSSIGTNICGCGSDSDCTGNSQGGRCDTVSGDLDEGFCYCDDNTQCTAGATCQPDQGAQRFFCNDHCRLDSDCPTGFFCNPATVCRPRCDTGHTCQAPYAVCDTQNLMGDNGEGVDGGLAGAMWCVGCETGDDCPDGQSCNGGFESDRSCGSCNFGGSCGSGEICLADTLCHATCDAGACPEGERCDRDDVAGGGFDVCYQCVTPADCPNGEGCNSATHTCGTCTGPTSESFETNCYSAYGGCTDCPPGDVCSNYWYPGTPGVCLQECDLAACPAGTTCAVVPQLSQDHAYCFACTSDADCADTGPGAWCDTSVSRTFTCRPASQ